ncbi:hypothetical protein DRO60_05895 [Candidatus Bathyarchaeota archaeon]|nr:MAG: hypothetical protein DRO60_05895 [Candidatus Bathyarchaeota archaeon]
MPFPAITFKKPFGGDDVVLQAVIPEPGEPGEPEIRIGPGIRSVVYDDPEDEDEEWFILEMLARFLTHEYLHVLLYFIEGKEACNALDSLNQLLWPYL